MTKEQTEPVFWLYEAGPERVKTFDEWFADYLAEAPLRLEHRNMEQWERDRLARSLWQTRRRLLAEKKSGRAWRGLRPRM